MKGYRQRMSWEVKDAAMSRLPLHLWLKFSACSLLMNMRRYGINRALLLELESYPTWKRRPPGRLFGFDSSKSRIGQIQTRNWIGMSLRSIQDPWTKRMLSRDAIRALLKRNLYLSYFQGENVDSTTVVTTTVMPLMICPPRQFAYCHFAYVDSPTT